MRDYYDCYNYNNNYYYIFIHSKIKEYWHAIQLKEKNNNNNKNKIDETRSYNSIIFTNVCMYIRFQKLD